MVVYIKCHSCNEWSPLSELRVGERYIVKMIELKRRMFGVKSTASADDFRVMLLDRHVKLLGADVECIRLCFMAAKE